MVDTAMQKVVVLVWGHIADNGSIEHGNMCITGFSYIIINNLNIN